MTDEERQAHDAEIARERTTLRVLSDVFEQATGRPVDLTAWSLDQLVRVLRNPDDVLALSRALTPPITYSTVYRNECEARARVIGPHEQVDQARAGIGSGRVLMGADYSALELRVLASIEAAPTREARQVAKGEGFGVLYNNPGALRQASRPSNFGLFPYQVAAVQSAAQQLGETMHRALEPIATFANTWAAQWAGGAELLERMQAIRAERPELFRITADDLRGRAPTMLIVDDPIGDRIDAMRYAYAFNPAPIMNAPFRFDGLDLAVERSNVGRWFADLEAREAITAPKRKRFKQARAPGEARNPMPPAQPFKRARR